MAKKKILLIDFDQEFLKFLSRALTDEGFEITTATDGLSGFERFSEIHPDLVIMEAMLPKFHGFELCSRITSHPAKKAPVIIVTGIYKDSVYKTEALRNLGASAFFEKPLNLEELLNKMYELIGKPETKKISASAERELDQLLKEALSMDTEEKKPVEKVRPVGKPKPTEKQVLQPRPSKEPQLSKDDEVDMILRSKLKDLMVDNSKPELRPEPKPEVKPTPQPAVKTELEKPAARPAQTRKAETTTTDSLLDELIKKPAAPPTPPRAPKAEPVRTQSRPESVIPARPEPKPEPRPEPRKEVKKEAQPASAPTPVDNRPRPAAPVVNPFKGFIEEKEEEKKKSRHGAGKYIGLAAAILAVAGVVAFLTLKKKEAPAFSGQTSQQVAALQTGNNQPAAPQQSEEEITQEIARQMEAYKAQKEQAPTDQHARKSSQGRSPNRQPAREEAAPFIPQQTTSLATMNTSPQAEPPQPQTNPPAETASEEKATSTETSAEKTSEPVQSAPEPQVVIPVQDIKPGDLIPLNMVDVEPKVVKTVEPVYPEADRRMGIKGQVLLNVLISENGDVLEAAVIRGIRGSVALEKEAINAVKKWKFLPAEKNGVKVRVWKPVTIGFGLDK
ncbi:MAG: TonB family protein [Candidatus Saccharicenans sp.]|uniref:TonB family protein n=1 Tax=Candidatus Saccharicenans sp. TaxID=2819258 RepID=UPI00404A501B